MTADALDPNRNRDIDNLDATIRNRPCRFVLFRELEAQAQRTKDWLVKGLLGAGEASAVFGEPGDGKSVLVEDIGLYVAANAHDTVNEPWHGREVQGGAVIYFALERKAAVERRALAFKLEHDLPDDIPFVIVGGAGVLDFRDPNVCKRIVEVIEATEDITDCAVVLIIIDTLNRALCGGDENSSKDMGAIIRATSILQADGERHVMWIHHTPHGVDRLRGHSSLHGALDTEIYVKHDRSARLRRATVVKQSDGENEGEQVAFTLKSVRLSEDTTAPVAVPVEGAPPSTKSETGKRSKALALVIDIIREYAVEAIRPWSDGPEVKAASIEAVRAEFYRRRTGTTATKNKAFNRCINGDDNNDICQRDGKCWIVSKKEGNR
jgi:hypothetical protein